MKTARFLLHGAILLSLSLSSCLGGDDSEATKEWRTLNEAYVDAAKVEEENGVRKFEQINPDWSPGSFVLLHWLNDRAKTAENLTPLDNSTVDVIYKVTDIKGNMIDNSYSATAHGDSIYRTQPYKNIVGFWTALTSMKVGDKVTAIIPYFSGYGTVNYGKIQAYSTLVYTIELRGIPAYQIKG